MLKDGAEIKVLDMIEDFKDEKRYGLFYVDFETQERYPKKVLIGTRNSQKHKSLNRHSKNQDFL